MLIQRMYEMVKYAIFIVNIVNDKSYDYITQTNKLKT